MKKIVVAVAIAIVGMAVNAASIGWTFTDMGSAFNHLGVAAEDGSVLAYLMIDSASVTGGESTFSYANAVAAVKKGDFSFTSNNYNDGGAGMALWGYDFGTSAGGLALGGADDNMVKAYLVLVDGEYGYISDLATVGIDATGNLTTGALDGNLVFANEPMGTASNWYTTSAVPEPTSGLLLLLGMAGLALRRKQA